MSSVHRIQEPGKGVGDSPPVACSGDDDGMVLTNEETQPEPHQQLASSDNPVQGQQDPTAAPSPPIDSPPSHHDYGDEEDPPSPRPIVMLDGIFSLNGKSITFPSRPTAEGGEDDYFDDLSSINTDHYHFSYAAPPPPGGGGGSSQPHGQPGKRVLGQLEPEYREPLASDDDASGYNNLQKKKQLPSASWYELHHRTAIADTTTSSSSNNNNSHPLGNKTQRGPYANNEKDGQIGCCDDDDNSSTAWGCCPECISGAPRWLKMVLCFSVLLLVAAMVMVGVGATMAMEKDREQQQATNLNNNDDMPSGTDTDFATKAPTTVPPSFPTPSSTLPPTALTQGPDSSTPVIPAVVTLYLTGGRFIDEALIALPDQLASLPYENNDPTTTFLVHLGDWNSPFSTECDETSYETNVDLFSHSSIPVYFVPGDNEYNGTYGTAPPIPSHNPHHRPIPSRILVDLLWRCGPTTHPPSCSSLSFYTYHRTHIHPNIPIKQTVPIQMKLFPFGKHTCSTMK